MDSYKIAILDGDGIGPEIMYEATKILDLVAERNQVNFELLHAPFGLQPISRMAIRFLKNQRIFVIRQMQF